MVGRRLSNYSVGRRFQAPFDLTSSLKRIDVLRPPARSSFLNVFFRNPVNTKTVLCSLFERRGTWGQSLRWTCLLVNSDSPATLTKFTSWQVSVTAKRHLQTTAVGIYQVQRVNAEVSPAAVFWLALVSSVCMLRAGIVFMWDLMKELVNLVQPRQWDSHNATSRPEY